MQITLPAIAFGSSVSESPIPTGGDGWSRWLRAVALGGQGFYAAAATDLRRLDDRRGSTALRSVAASTRASHLRQVGRHHRAAVHDGAALELAAHGDRGRAPGTGAWCDALTGLAADNLGRGMFGAADRLLARVEQILDHSGIRSGGDISGRDRYGDDEYGDDLEVCDVEDWIWGPRLEMRWRWVRAELAMYTADAVAATEHAAAAATIAAAGPSLRHQIKSELIGAAAAAAAGDTDTAGDRALRVAAEAAGAGQLPLQWAAAKLLDGIGVGQTCAGRTWADQARQLGRVLAERGGAMS